MAGGLIGVPLDMFLTQLGSKIASGALGVLGLLVGTYPLKGQGRLQTDAFHISSRVLSEILDPSPDQIRAIQRNIGDAFDGVVQGRLDKVFYAFVRNPRELTSLVPGPAKEKEAAADEKRESPKSKGRVVYL